MPNFFISYNKADLPWAEWIAWQLEAVGYTSVIQAWDFRPGSNFVLDMQNAAAQPERTIAVLSPDYLSALYTQPEWAAAFAQDPTGEKGTLLPVRVRACELKGLLFPVVYIDLVGRDRAAAKQALLAGVKRGRAKPDAEPDFPAGRPPRRPPRRSRAFPAACRASGTSRIGATPTSRDAKTICASCAPLSPAATPRPSSPSPAWAARARPSLR